MNIPKFSRTFVIALSLVVVQAPRAGGIPVIDTASIAQTILVVKAHAKDLQQLIEQVKTAKNQLVQAKATLQSLTGSRGMSTLLDMTGIRQALPPELLKTADAIRSLGAAAASKDAKRIYDAISRHGCDLQFPTNVEMRKLCEADAYSSPTTLSMVQDSVKRSEQRATKLQQMLSSIDTTDAKAAADLTNRIQAETAMLQNEKMLMDMALQNQQLQKDLVAQQIKELGQKALTSKAGFDPFKN
ncbi:type IV secretion system protein [Delftia sp. GW456-R20]|uniref:type IV secretion system protein n=1 Tax=Delftia sp. GW456-R20 TaxID=1827145 RepID=UPI0009EF4E5A|nr:type IV secretion system protein [Delftia sp. GW456-R20]